MHAHIAEVFEVSGVILALVRIADPASPPSGWSGILTQTGTVLRVDGSRWVEMDLPPPPEVATTPSPPSARAYLVAFADAARAGITPARPVTLTLSADGSPVAQCELGVTPLPVVRLQDPVLRLALAQALRAAGMPGVASFLSAPVQVAPIPQFGAFAITRAVVSNTSLVLRGHIDGPRRAVHLVTADLRGWTAEGQLAWHPLDERAEEEAASRENKPVGDGFTAVLAVGPDTAETAVYVVEADPSGDRTVFYGPVTVTASRDSTEAIQLVRQGFGPPQALPVPLVQQIYRPLMATAPAEVRARRIPFGPAVDELAGLTSIIIALSGDAFWFNSVVHLQRRLGPGFEIILVVDDPRIGPEIHARLITRQSGLTVPTVFLQCADPCGYVQASNLGFKTARGDVLIRMSPDVLVANPTDLARAAAEIRVRQQAGQPETIIGFSLLDETESVRHLGLVLPQPSRVGALGTAPSSLAGEPLPHNTEDAIRRVPAVTGALMALSARLCHTLGGLDPVFQHRSFADMDLCLRAQQVGAEVQLQVRSGLYHLEQADEHPVLAEAIAHLDAAIFNTRWGADLPEQAGVPEATPAGPSSPQVIRILKRQDGYPPREGRPLAPQVRS